MSVGDITEREDRPAAIRFEKRPKEDKEASRLAGSVIYEDINYVLVTPPYSKDVFESKVELWFENVEKNVRNGRTPQKWFDYWKECYARWKKGEEAPLNGTSVKNWSAITPAQVKTLLVANIVTIEDLAIANDEGIRRLGMGGVDLKNKARAYVQATKDTGPLVMENAALKKEVEILNGTVSSLSEKIEILGQRLQSISSQPLVQVESTISAEDILPEITSHTEEKSIKEQYIEKFGKKPHHLLKEETMLKRLAE